MDHQHKSVMKMRTYYLTLVFACLLVVNCATADSIEPQKSTSTAGSKVASDLKDLDASASDHLYLISGDQGYGGISGVGSGYGSRGVSTYANGIGRYPSLGSGSIYKSGTSYRNVGLTPSYRGYQAGGYGNGIIGGGHTGYGYYGGSGGYGGYGGQNTYGGVGTGLVDDGYSSYGSRRVGYGGGYNGGYGGSNGGYGGSNFAASNPYEYRGSGGYGGSSYRRYGGYGYQPSGYRGYS